MRNCSLRVSSIILFLGFALGASAAQNQAAEKIETRVESKAIPPSVVYEISRTVGAGRTLKQDGMEKVLMGVTDMAQVRAVCIK